MEVNNVGIENSAGTSAILAAFVFRGILIWKYEYQKKYGEFGTSPVGCLRIISTRNRLFVHNARRNVVNQRKSKQIKRLVVMWWSIISIAAIHLFYEQLFIKIPITRESIVHWKFNGRKSIALLKDGNLTTEQCNEWEINGK